MHQVRYPPWRKRTENPCVGGSIPPHTTESLIKSEAFLFYEHPVRYPPWRKRTENPCVGGLIPPLTTTRHSRSFRGCLFFESANRISYLPDFRKILCFDLILLNG